jgi:ankyrin repeat protein
MSFASKEEEDEEEDGEEEEEEKEEEEEEEKSHRQSRLRQSSFCSYSESEEEFEDAVSELSEEWKDATGEECVVVNATTTTTTTTTTNANDNNNNDDDDGSMMTSSVVNDDDERRREREENVRARSSFSSSSSSSSSSPSFSERFPFHKACFENDMETVREFLIVAERLKTMHPNINGNRSRDTATAESAATNARSSLSNEKETTLLQRRHRQNENEEAEEEKKYGFDVLNSFDSRGNTALHLAIMRKNTDLVRVLTEHPLVDVNVKNSIHGWKPLDEAIHVKDRQAAIYIVTAKKRKAKENLETNSPEFMQRLMEAPNFSAKLKWELNSPIFGPILRRVAPSDTYTLTKIGTRVRIDGELRGVEDVEEYNLEENTAESSDNGEMRKRNSFESNGSYEKVGQEGAQISTSLSDASKEMKKKKKKKRGGLLPVWHRAPFSIVFLANPKEEEEEEEATSEGKVSTAMLYLDHENKKCIDALEETNNSSTLSKNTTPTPSPQSDLFKDLSVMTPEEQIENEVDLLFVENPSRGVYEPQEYTFAPVDSWGSYLGVSKRKKESKIDGRYAKVMEAKGKAMETRKYRSGFLPEDEGYDFESYASDAKEFQDQPIYRDVTRIRSVGKKRNDDDLDFSDKRKKKSKSLEDIDDGTMGRKMSCRVWLVENFPLKVHDLLPVVEVASQTNKNMKRFRNLLVNWGSGPNRQNFFPVKCSIPIAYTVHFDILLHNFKLLAKDECDRLQFQDKIFSTPDGYDLKGLDEAVKELEEKLNELEATAMAEEERERAFMREEED